MRKIDHILTVQEAYTKYSALCARQECCRQDLADKMFRKGMSSEAVAEVIQQLQAEGFVDDERFCRAYIHDKFYFSRWGRIRLRMELRKRKIGDDIIARCLQDIDEDEYKELLWGLLSDYARTVTAKSDFERQCKIVRFASQRGFEQSLAIPIAESLTD